MGERLIVNQTTSDLLTLVREISDTQQLKPAEALPLAKNVLLERQSQARVIEHRQSTTRLEEIASRSDNKWYEN